MLLQNLPAGTIRLSGLLLGRGRLRGLYL